MPCGYERSMIGPCVNPHGFRLTRPLKAMLCIEVNGAAIGYQHVLMKTLVAGL